MSFFVSGVTTVLNGTVISAEKLSQWNNYLITACISFRQNCWIKMLQSQQRT